MASFVPTDFIRSFPFALTGTSSTDVYTVGDQDESAAWLIGVVVVDPTGSVATTAKVGVYRNPTEFRLSPNATGKPNTTSNLEIICEPALYLKRGDEVRVTGASGHHVWTTVALVGVATGTAAQSASVGGSPSAAQTSA